MEKYFAKFHIAGTFWQEKVLKEIKNRSIDELDFPPYTFGFELSTKVKENDRTITINKKTYKIGKILTLNEVELLYGKNTPAYRNVGRLLTKNSTAFFGVACNLQVISKKDIILDPHNLPQFKETLNYYDKRLSVINEKTQEL